MWNKKLSEFYKLNICQQIEAELSFFLLADHFKISVHAEQA